MSELYLVHAYFMSELSRMPTVKCIATSLTKSRREFGGICDFSIYDLRLHLAIWPFGDLPYHRW